MRNRYEYAIAKNLDELQRAILIRISLSGIEQAGEISILFLKLAYNSLFNDYIAKCIKVFESSKQAASFWYVHRSNEAVVQKYAKQYKVDLVQLKTISDKLKHLRDKAHFHIDTDGIKDQSAVWAKAAITEKDLFSAVQGAFHILLELNDSLQIPRENYPDYNATYPYRIAIKINSGEW